MAGLPIYGNYHGYYTKRPFLNDERLLVLPPALFEDARVLDVGCNEGWVTCEIAQLYGAKFVLGVDIDNTLIQAAWRRRRAVWSTQGPTSPNPCTDQCDAEMVSDSQQRTRPNYFPASCEHEFSFLPIPPAENREKEIFPHNISFRTADWVKTDIPEDKEGYDVVVGFSISKWIHINDGDEGLKTFFRRVFEVLKPGGRFVFEPQPWDSYAKARRMSQKLFKENENDVRLRPENFGLVLQNIGFRHLEHFEGIGSGGFQRPIDLYMKP